MLKKVERDFKQTIGNHMRIAILANFMPSVIKDYIYVNVQLTQGTGRSSTKSRRSSGIK